MSNKAKMQHCPYCGAELGVYVKPWGEVDTCGSTKCEREARADERHARDEAHERLDREMGWD